MGGEEESNKGESKGFAGLSSFVSDVGTTPSSAAPKKEHATTAPSAEQASLQPAQTQPAQSQPNEGQTYREPIKPSTDGSSAGKWALVIAAIIGVFWLIDLSSKANTTSPASAYSPSRQSTAPNQFADPPEFGKPSPPAQPQAPSRPTESKPPVGENQVLSMAQIRYCLAEDIRMDGAKLAINNYIDSDVDRFNAMVADYNSRCSSFRYQTNNRGRNDLNRAQRDIEPFRSQFQSEGRSRFARGKALSNQPAGSAVTKPSVPADSALQAMLLDSLRLRLGSDERMVDSGKMIVALSKSGYVSLKPDARFDYSDYRFLKKPIYIYGHELFVVDEEYFDHWVGCCVSPGIAVTLKLRGNTDSLQTFARNNKCRVGFDGDLYYGPTLPSAPKGTYATLSCKERDSR
ncbi:MAG: hypothetical protein KIG95_05755 [Comamonas sp.]|nr:hypothetical protein [Comamonas sp.]